MSESFFYPTLDAKTMKNLAVVQQLSIEHPSYWLTSPYSGDIQNICLKLFKPQKVVHEYEDNSDANDGTDNWEFLFNESKTLFKGLKAAKLDNDTASEKMAYFRTATSLLDKLLSIQERSNNLKQVSEFYSIVMSIMDETLSPAQRTEVMTQLQDAVKGKI